MTIGLAQVHPSKEPREPKSRRKGGASQAGYPLSSPKRRVIYGGKGWVFRPERKIDRGVQERR